MARKTTMRRQPLQERGRRRIEVLLDAAEKEFARVGYEAATTNAIAQRARTSVGSLYQFFPNKEAVLRALAERYLEQLREVHDRVFDDEAARLPLPALYDRIIHTLADFHQAHPGFQPLFYGSATSKHLTAVAAKLHGECIDRVDALMAARAPRMDQEQRRLYATMNVEVIKALLPLSESGDPGFRALVLEEIKNLLLAHMRAILDRKAASGGRQ
jgi:AcrR family transcriptional regulator